MANDFHVFEHDPKTGGNWFNNQACASDCRRERGLFSLKRQERQTSLMFVRFGRHRSS